jgi:peptide/nickel transport system ATP-binding protein
LIELEGVSVTYGAVRAARDISFRIAAGDALGLVGESGSGKSTVLRAVAGLIPHAEGSVVINGRELPNRRPRDSRKIIQMVFQDPYGSLHPNQTVDQTLSAPIAIHRLGNAESRIMAALTEVGLGREHRYRYPHQLSGGQRQRVAIARALVLHPRIVVCDEPTSALDVSVQAQILNLLAELRRDLGLTYVFISHNLAVVEHIATEVAVMYLGRFVEHAPVDALFRDPRHPYTRALLASVLTPEPGKGIPEVGLGDSYPDPANIPPGCRFHPRCPMAEPRCSERVPIAVTRGARMVECLLETA